MISSSHGSSSSALVGRSRECERLLRLLESPGLVTLLGPGGVGKTRLAAAVAGKLEEGFAHGAHVVYLSALTDAQLLAPTLARELGIKLRGVADPAEELLAQLRKREMLLVLDNFEQLLDATALLQRIRVGAPGVRLLVTSRVPLGLRKEKLFRLGGLSLPAPGEDANESEAMRLFVERARQRKPGWRLRGREDAVVRICRAVEGLPLGIELAAAWVGERTLSRIAGEVERRREEFLEEKLGEVPGWQPGLRAVLGSAWAQLEEEERRVFRGVSVFRGSFTRASAAEVLGADLAALERLVERSLVRRSAPERYDVHEVLRQYGRERLQQAGEEEGRLQRAHATCYADFLEAREERMYGAKELLDAVTAEADNVHAAWRWAAERGEVKLLDRALRGLYRFYNMKGWMLEGELSIGYAAQRLRSLRRSVRERDRVLGRLVSIQAYFSGMLGRWEEANAAVEEGLRLLEPLGPSHDLVDAVNICGILFGREGQYDRAAEAFLRAKALGEEIGDESIVTRTTSNLGETFRRAGRYEEARRYLREGLEIFRRRGIVWDQAPVLESLGEIEHQLGNHQEAIRLVEEGLTILQAAGNQQRIAGALAALGRAHLALGEPERAWERLREGLRTAVESRTEPAILELLLGVAELWLKQGELKRARELIGLVFAHPASDEETREGAERLTTGLDPLEPRPARTLQEVVGELLGDSGHAGDGGS